MKAVWDWLVGQFTPEPEWTIREEVTESGTHIYIFPPGMQFKFIEQVDGTSEPL